MLHLADIRLADIFRASETQFLSKWVIVGHEREALPEEVLILGEGQLVDELAWERDEVEAEALEEHVLTRVGGVGTQELGGLVKGTQAKNENRLEMHVDV